ncbi:cell division protein FtsB [Mycolicibacterium iranicum]|uniref:Cell division protein FtsB n=1 Tax=Mycolicibacterium iranicum TaxID=912594 RepID=A0A839Q9D7_MYCIR|nr:septum formation initiator family protein [Mycolicibacterium iranicum]MBB2991045.1 cell division protein FtsB [Mycolicibacterium iranicum]
MPEAKRPDPKRRSGGDARAKKAPASRPGRPGDGARGKPRTSSRRDTRGSSEPKAIEAKAAESAAGSKAAGSKAAGSKALSGPVEDAEFVDLEDGDAGGSIRRSIVASAEAAAEQRFGSAARRAAILAAVICVLTLTIAGPVRTYFGQRTEMKQLQASEAQLREQISELEEQKAKLADPVFIAAQARERLGFVMPGEIPYQVQLPPGATQPGAPVDDPTESKSTDPWYTALWHTIAEAPHGGTPTAPPMPPGSPGAPEPLAPGAPQPGG